MRFLNEWGYRWKPSKTANEQDYRVSNHIISEDYNTQDISNDSYIDVTKQEMSYYQDYLDNPKKANEYHKTTSQIVEMSPKEYFEECAKIFDSTFEKQYTQIKNDTETVDYLKDVILKQNKKFPIPILNYAENTQDGRHRMFVLGELFGWDKEFPILVINETEEGKNYRKHSEIIKALNIITNKALEFTYLDLNDLVSNLEYYLDDLKDYVDYDDIDIQTFDNYINIQVDNVNYRITKDDVKINPNKYDELDDELDVNDLLDDSEYKNILK